MMFQREVPRWQFASWSKLDACSHGTPQHVCKSVNLTQEEQRSRGLELSFPQRLGLPRIVHDALL